VHIIFAGRWSAIAEMRFAAGDPIAVGAAILWSFFSLQVRRLPRELHPISLTVCAAASGLVFLGAAYAAWGLTGHPWFRQAMPTMGTAEALGLVVYIALVPTLLGNLLFTAGVQRVGAANAGAMQFLTPVFATLLAITVLGERLQLFHAIGIAGIGLGLWVATVRRR